MGAASTRLRCVTDPQMLLLVDFPKFMRNLLCDHSPHLYHDIRPNFTSPWLWRVYYAEYTFAYPPTNDLDLFKCNPWYSQPNVTFAVANDNSWLYYDPAASPVARVLRLGTVNPPVTVIPGDMTASPRSYLFRNTPVGVHGIGIWDMAAPFTYIYTVSTRGLGDSPVDIVPYAVGQDWQGIRINCELYDPDSYWLYFGTVNNIQTFLMVQGAGTDVPTIEIDDGTGGESAVSRNMRLPESRRLEPGSPTYRAVQEAVQRLRRR
jgi:hypothetical protein